MADLKLLASQLHELSRSLGEIARSCETTAAYVEAVSAARGVREQAIVALTEALKLQAEAQKALDKLKETT